MSGRKRTEAWDRTRKATDQIKPMAAQLKPLAKSTGEAAQRQWFRTRAWAAPRVERTGKVLEQTVAPKVSDILSEAAERIDPARPKRGRWRLPVGIAAAIAAAASGAAAALRNRSKTKAAASVQDASGAAATGVSELGEVDHAQAEPVTEDKQAQVR